MLEFPHILAEIDSVVLETHEYLRVWHLSNPVLGTKVCATHRLDEITGCCYFVIPEPHEHQDAVSILTIARGRPPGTVAEPLTFAVDEVSDELAAGETRGSAQMPIFWDPTKLSDQLGGVYAHVAYHPARAEFELGMNVGNETADLFAATLTGATPDLVCRRVLELYFEISAERCFFSIHDRFAGGDLSFDTVVPSTGRNKHPWGASAAGHWWVMSGVDGRPRHSLPLPVGFGLSNLRVTLGAENHEAIGSLHYDGVLDHLSVRPPKRLSRQDFLLLTKRVKALRQITTDIERIRLQLPIASSFRI